MDKTTGGLHWCWHRHTPPVLPPVAKCLLHYLRTRSKAVGGGRGGSGGRRPGGRGRKGDPLSQAQAELSNAALPVVVGMQVLMTYNICPRCRLMLMMFFLTQRVLRKILSTTSARDAVLRLLMFFKYRIRNVLFRVEP